MESASAVFVLLIASPANMAAADSEARAAAFAGACHARGRFSKMGRAARNARPSDTGLALTFQIDSSE
jgi:hypothetical protein